VSIGISTIIGAVSGLLVIITAKQLERWKIDDPVGAIPVHFVCGGWGTLAVGLFASSSSSEYQLENYRRIAQLLYQILGWLSVSLMVGALSLLTWLAIGLALYLSAPSRERVSKQQLEAMREDAIPNAVGKPSISPVVYWFYICRQGLRVPVGLEEQGQEPTLTV
ncbi:MAG: ammonium permease, partial [Cyanobacteria bacterium P01_D01_bin.105]